MSVPSIYTLGEIASESGASPNLLTFLLHDRQIPHKRVGTAKVVDEQGRAELLEAIADYRRKAPAEAC